MQPALDQLPPGYVVHRVGPAWLLLDRECAPALVPLRLGEEEARRALFARAPRRGRGAAPSVRLPNGATAVLRRYRHGGLLGGLTRSLLLGPARALSELAVTASAEGRGAPVPHVLCLVTWPIAGPFWSALIGTREEPRARELHTALLRAADARERLALVRAAGAAVRRLHDAGVEHRDLQFRNVLVAEESGAPRIVVVDLDRARFWSEPMPVSRRAANLGRLARSAVKLGLPGRAGGRRELAAFAGAYCAGDRALRRELRRRAGRERFKLALHRASYALRRGAEDPSRRIPRSASPPRRA
jgi:3-deoxy-D-manno-octulosonic acid kinase